MKFFPPTLWSTWCTAGRVGERFARRASGLVGAGVAGLALLVTLASAASAQTPAQRNLPRAGYVYPAGGRQGATVTVTVGGQFLGGVTAAWFSGEGVTAKVVDYRRPMNQKEFNDLRDQIAAMVEQKRTAAGLPAATATPPATATTSAPAQRPAATSAAGVSVVVAVPAAPGPPSAAAKVAAPAAGATASVPATPAAVVKTGWTPADEQELVALRALLEKNRLLRLVSPAMSETITLEVTLAPDAAVGEREVRLQAPFALTNPLVFCVGQLPEFGEPLAEPQASPALRPARNLAAASRPVQALTFTLPATVNGQIMPGSVDRCQFAARKGQRIVAAVSARALIPYLADAVPGWFQATLAVFDPQGRELAYADHFRFNPDPVLSCVIPADGNYTLEIKDAIYRGREDFVYRVAIGELPFITSIYPLGGPAGAHTAVELTGWNLPATRLDVDGTGKLPGVTPLSVLRGELRSNFVPFVFEARPNVAEAEANAQPTTAQPVKLPVIINGRIGRPGDTDVFRFEGRAGDDIVAEVFARRLNSPLDSVLRLTDAAGHQLAFNDDFEDKGAGLLTHQADSRLALKLPADGTYYLNLGDIQHQGGPEHAYRLHLGPPQPDFALRLVPSSLSVRGGMAVPVTVYALRRDGFAGEITLELANPATGFKLSGARIPAGQDKARFTLTAPAVTGDQLYPLSLVGRATIAGQPVVHAAVPAEDMMQAFAYRHLVPVKEFQVAVANRGVQRILPVPPSAPVRIPAGGMARFSLTLQGVRQFPSIELELSEPPDGVTVPNVTPAGNVLNIAVVGDAAKARPGLQGNLILTAYGLRPADPATKQPAQRVQLAVLPAIPFEIVAPKSP